MEESSTTYFSYLLRMWRTSQENPWRASLEDPQTGERIGFGSLEALLDFLRRKAEAPPHASAGEPYQEQQPKLS